MEAISSIEDVIDHIEAKKDENMGIFSIIKEIEATIDIVSELYKDLSGLVSNSSAEPETIEKLLSDLSSDYQKAVNFLNTINIDEKKAFDAAELLGCKNVSIIRKTLDRVKPYIPNLIKRIGYFLVVLAILLSIINIVNFIAEKINSGKQELTK